MVDAKEAPYQHSLRQLAPELLCSNRDLPLHLPIDVGETDFTLEGPYEVWTQVNKGELDGANAIMSRMLQFKGSMSAIIRYSKAFLRLFQVMQKVPVEY